MSVTSLLSTIHTSSPRVVKKDAVPKCLMKCGFTVVPSRILICSRDCVVTYDG